jgi:hypothetical protein
MVRAPFITTGERAMSKLVRSSKLTPGLGRVCLFLCAISLGLGGTALAAADTSSLIGFRHHR